MPFGAHDQTEGAVGLQVMGSHAVVGEFDDGDGVAIGAGLLHDADGIGGGLKWDPANGAGGGFGELAPMGFDVDAAADKQPFIALLENGMTAGALAHLAADTSFNTTNINLVGLAQTGIEYIPVS
jgi:hypothetical protein